MARTKRAEVFKGARGWYFRVVAGNGQITEQSESYTRKSSARRAAKQTGLPVVDGEV